MIYSVLRICLSSVIKATYSFIVLAGKEIIKIPLHEQDFVLQRGSCATLGSYELDSNYQVDYLVLGLSCSDT